MLTRTWYPLVVGVALSCTSCSCYSSDDGGHRRISGRITGSGTAAEKTLELASFHSVDAGSALELVLHAGQAQRVVLSGDSNMLQHVKAKVSNGELELSMEGLSLAPKLPLKVEIWMPELKALTLSGAANLEAENLALPALQLSLSGASEARISGHVDVLTADLSGASELKARQCTVKEAKLDLSGASEGELDVREQVTADCSGASDLDLWGDPPQRNVECSGASDVQIHEASTN